jgi:hypothetical protein
MKRLLGLTLVATAGLSIAIANAAEPERIRGTVSAISANEVTVSTATGDISMQAGAGTKYLTVVRSNLDHIAAGSYIGVAAKNVGDKLVALDVLIFPPAMKGAAQGHFGWDRMPDTTLSGGASTASNMTNGSVAVVAQGSAAPVASSMTNGSVAAASEGGGVKQVTLTYKGGQQTILVPPTAPVVTLQPGAASDLKPGDKVFVNAIVDGGKTTAALILVGSDSFAPPI